MSGIRAAVCHPLPPWSLSILVGSVLTAAGLVPTPVSSAGLFRCLTKDGQTVFTDRPAQMTQCEPLLVESGPSSPSAAITPAPPIAPALPTELSITSRVAPLDISVPTADSNIAVPVRKVGQLYVVSVELNGTRMAHLILDTGASHTILSQELVRDLALMPSDFRPGLVLLKTAGGSVDAQVVRIDSMKIATAEVRNSSAAVHTVPDFPAGIDGLLGLSFLHEFEVTLDTMKSELRLKRQR